MLGPGDVWGAWHLDPVVIVVVAVVALAYGVGVRRLWRARRGRALPVRRVVCFYGGLSAVVFALLSPLDALGGSLFSAHMVQHLTLMVVAPPLLVYGAPLVPVALALPLGPRRATLRLGKRSSLHRVALLVGAPVTVWVVHMGALWAWHIPSLYAGALRNDFLHVLEHASFFTTALLFWSVVIAPARRTGASYGTRLALVFGTALQSGALGATLTFASVALYAVHAEGAQAWGLSALEDQRLAGVIMWIPAGAAYLATMSITLVRALKDMEVRMRRAEEPSGVSLGSSKEPARPAPVAARLGDK